MPYSGYTSKELRGAFRLTPQAIKQSGLMALLGKSYPFGPRSPLYREADVADWVQRLARRRALIAFGYIPKNSPVLDAPDDDRWDDECPKCGGFAVADREATPGEYTKLVAAGRFPRRWWCDRCGIVEAG